MMRIVLMVLRLIIRVPYYMAGIWWYGQKKDFDLEKSYAFVKKVTKAANRAGRVRIESHGLENIPKEDGFIFFPTIRVCLMCLYFWNHVRFRLLL